MANRRMFSLSVVDTDVFLDLSKDAQLLYFHLGMRADDDGFVASPRRIVRMIDCNAQCLEELEEYGFILSFSTGVIVIRHWNVSNWIPKDRHTETIHIQEKSLLTSGTRMTADGKKAGMPYEWKDGSM